MLYATMEEAQETIQDALQLVLSTNHEEAENELEGRDEAKLVRETLVL